MQSEEMKTQSDPAVREGYISREGYGKLLRCEKEERLKMMKQLKEDIVGFLYDIPAYLDTEGKQESREETRIFDKLTDYLNGEINSFDIRNTVSCLVTEYSIASEESGFRRGFHMAMRLCMEGLGGAEEECIFRHTGGIAGGFAGSPGGVPGDKGRPA